MVDLTIDKTPEGTAFRFFINCMVSNGNHMVYVDKDFNVIHVSGPFDMKVYERRWIGQNINVVREDVEQKLYKSFIHREDWSTNKEMQKLLLEKAQQDKAVGERRYWIEYYTRMDNMDFEQKENLERAIKEKQTLVAKLSITLDKLNKMRAESFGLTDHIPTYFKAENLEVSE
jgi:hypothetical protein